MHLVEMQDVAAASFSDAGFISYGRAQVLAEAAVRIGKAAHKHKKLSTYLVAMMIGPEHSDKLIRERVAHFAVGFPKIVGLFIVFVENKVELTRRVWDPCRCIPLVVIFIVQKRVFWELIGAAIGRKHIGKCFAELRQESATVLAAMV
eukprot:6205778-Pleurochrysis_carterae.AAC.3